MIRFVVLCCLLCAVIAAPATAASVTTFTDKGAFLDALGPNFYENAFDEVTRGFRSSPLSFAVDGWAYDIKADLDAFYNDDGRVGLNTASDSIVIDFTGDDVFAFGFNGFATSASFDVVRGTMFVQVLLTGSGPDDYIEYSYITDDILSSYFGLTSDVAIDRVTLSSEPFYPYTPQYAALDNLIVGAPLAAVVPTPAAAGAGLVLLGIVGGMRLRRQG